MKTFEEALKATVSMKGRPPEGPGISLSERNARELAREITGSRFATEYISGMVHLSIERLPPANTVKGETNDDEYFQEFTMSLAMTAFLAGVRVGQAMEKEDLEP